MQEKYQGDYASAFVLNPPTLQEPTTIYALDAGTANNDVVRRHYPNRPTWFIGRSSIDGGIFRVRAGPLSSKADIAEIENSKFR